MDRYWWWRIEGVRASAQGHGAMTGLLALLVCTYFITALTGLVTEHPHRAKAGTALSITSLILLTGIIVADRVVDL